MPIDASTPRVEHELFIRSFFPLAPPARVATQLASAMRDVSFAAGETLYHRGQPADNLYFVVNGEVALEAPGEAPWRFGGDSLLGILDASASAPHSRTARALAPTHAVSLCFADYLDVLEDNFEYSKGVLQLGAQTINTGAWKLAPDRVFPPDFGAQESFVQDSGAEVDPITRLLVLRATPLLSRAPVQALARLMRLATQSEWQAEDVLYDEGSPSDVMYVVMRGRVSITRQSPEVNAAAGPNRIVGGLSAFGSDQHCYTARALERTLTLNIRKEDFFDVAEDHFGLGRAVFHAVGAERARINSEVARLEQGA